MHVTLEKNQVINLKPFCYIFSASIGCFCIIKIEPALSYLSIFESNDSFDILNKSFGHEAKKCREKYIFLSWLIERWKKYKLPALSTWTLPDK